MISLRERIHFLHRCMRYRWRTERLALATLMSLHLRDQSVLDIGANRGIYCYWLARAIGTNGQLLAVEPQPELAKALAGLAEHFTWPGFRLHAVGLSDQPGTLTLQRSRVGDGSATMDPTSIRLLAGHAQLIEPIDVAVVRLDDLLADYGRTIRFIKCDVEGHELAVLEGASEIIERHRPMLQIEIRADDPRSGALIDRLASLGYRGVMMLDGNYLNWREFDRVPSRRFGRIGHRDLLCFDPRLGQELMPVRLWQRVWSQANAQ